MAERASASFSTCFRFDKGGPRPDLVVAACLCFASGREKPAGSAKAEGDSWSVLWAHDPVIFLRDLENGLVEQ